MNMRKDVWDSMRKTIMDRVLSENFFTNGISPMPTINCRSKIEGNIIMSNRKDREPELTIEPRENGFEVTTANGYDNNKKHVFRTMQEMQTFISEQYEHRETSIELDKD